MPKTLEHDDLLKQPPRDRYARVVHDIVEHSRKGLSQQAAAHHEALINSFAAKPNDSFITADAPYGQNISKFYADRVVADITSTFTAEQVNAITTRLVTPLLGQREVLYFEPRGAGDVLKARVREVLWERAIRGPFTSWGELIWRTYRDVVVRSRGYIEVQPLNVKRMRRRYSYDDPMAMDELIASGAVADAESLAALGTLRMSTMEYATLWNGPILRPLPFGSVHKDRADVLINEASLFHIVERRMPFQQVIELGQTIFGDGVETLKVKFSQERVRSAAQTGADAGSTEPIGATDADQTGDHARLYEPVRYFEFRGLDPLSDSGEEIILWVMGGETIGAKGWDGSGSPLNVCEFGWDPTTGFTTSASPALLIRAKQEMLSRLGSDALSAAEWQSHLSGGVNMMAVSDINQVKQLRPATFFKKISDAQAIEPIQVGRNSETLLNMSQVEEDRARLATAGTAAVVGDSPTGVNTLGEFAGISKGAMDRIGVQGEINNDNALVRMVYRVNECWRDIITTDAQLQDLLGANPDTLGATVKELDGDLPVVVMAERYERTRQFEFNAISAILAESKVNPEVQMRLKPEIYDDWAMAAAGSPRVWRWLASNAELQASGIDPNALKQQAMMQQQAAGGPPGSTPSAEGGNGAGAPSAAQPPAPPPPTSSADLMPVT